MDYKTILVLCDASDASASRMAFARQLACNSDAHLIALQLPPLFTSPMTLGESFDMANRVRCHDENVKAGVEKGKALFDAVVQGPGPTSEWLVGDWSTAADPVELAKSADLVVMGQEERERSDSHLPRALPEAVIMGSGRPVMVVPLASKTPARLAKAVVCWDGTREAALAASLALPLLKAAETVDVLVVKPRLKSAGDQSNSRLVPLAWLGRHGVVVRVQERLSQSDDVGKEIVAYASEVNADLIVMGGYGHSRLRQALLGGVSRTVTEESPVPVVMAH
jgi:nucleotide-binding universal stress UspA family protein